MPDEPEAPAIDQVIRRRQTPAQLEPVAECAAPTGKGDRAGNGRGAFVARVGAGDVADGKARVDALARGDEMRRRAGHRGTVDRRHSEWLVAGEGPGVAAQRVDLRAN